MNAPTKNLPAERKPQVVAGGQIAALVPQSLDEAFRLSSALAASGLAPRGMDRPEQVMVAILAGAELGLPPYQAMQSFAVVNGRATIWGDAIPALLWSGGFKIAEWFDNDDEPTRAFCKVTRPDGTEIERTFSVAQAKKAGLWGKTGPWTQYPGRMLQMRARALAARDGATDALRGIQVREEVDDYTHVRDVTPKPSGLRDRLNGPTTDEGFSQHHAAPHAPVEFAEQAEEIAEAEFAEGVRADLEEVLSEASEREVAATEAEPFDPIGWAADLNQNLDGFATLADLNAFTDDPANAAKFAALAQESAGIAKSLEAAITGKRKALASMART